VWEDLFDIPTPILTSSAASRANESLSARPDTVTALDAKISELEGSLSVALDDVKAKVLFLGQLQAAKNSFDAEISTLKTSWQQVRAEHARGLASLNSVKEEVRFTLDFFAVA
jgi:hypothetical protein